jgi:hypothetical protein
MDYVARQFINLAKKLRKELRKSLSDLSSALYKQTKAIRESSERQDNKESPRQEIVAIVNLPESVEVHQNECDTRTERRYRNRTLFVSALTLIAIVIYAVLVYLQYREMINATGVAQQTLVESRRNRLQAEKALDATINQFHLDQRAWLGPSEILPPAFNEKGKLVFLKEGEQASFSCLIINSGKTPAKHVIQRASYISIPLKEAFVPRYPGTPSNVGVIQPNQKMRMQTPNTERVTTSIINGITTGTFRLYVFGSVTYEDVFGNAHHTTYCLYLFKDLTNFVPCSTYNDAD